MSPWNDRFRSLIAVGVAVLLMVAGSAPGAPPAEAERVLQEARQALECR